MKPIEQIWQQLVARGPTSWPVYQRIDETHPIDFYAGIGSDGAKLLVLISVREPMQLPSYHAFTVAKALRGDGRWNVTVQLKRPQFVHVFAHLCDDLISTARTECAPDNAGQFLIERIERWQKLLGRDRTGLLTLEEVRGLIGELLFLRNMCPIDQQPEHAVRSWEGPYDAPQDFRLAERFVEVKTCGPLNLLVWISSAEQLDRRSMPIVLSVAVVEPSDPQDGRSFTLSSLVNGVRATLEKSRSALQAFDEKMKLTGFVDREEYTRDCFALREFRHFDIQDQFPRLERQSLPDAIVSLEYQLDLLKCLSFEREYQAGL